MTADPRAHLPLKPIVFSILLALVEQERHGWDLVRELERRDPGRSRILPGNLYRTLREMRTAGLIDESDRRPSPGLDDERRRYFRVTAWGRAVAKAEASRMDALVKQAAGLKLHPGRRR